MNKISSHCDKTRPKIRPFWLGLLLSVLFIPAYLALTTLALLVVLACWPMFIYPVPFYLTLGLILLSCIPVTVRQHRALNRVSPLWSAVGVILVVAILVGGAVAFISAAGRVRMLRNEERVHSTFMPVINALYAYSVDNANVPPNDLRQLVPRYLTMLPDSPQHSVCYEVMKDGTNWVLSVSCCDQRFYIHRAGNRYTESERNRMTKFFHQTWAVFPQPR